MTDNINYQLARAIGWREKRVRVFPDETVCCFDTDYLQLVGDMPVPGCWRIFDHTDPVVADALVERYQMAVLFRHYSKTWSAWNWEMEGIKVSSSRHRAIALAVIALNKG